MNTKLLQKIKYNKFVVRLYSKMMEQIQQNILPVDVPEVRSLGCCRCEQSLSKLRLNLLIPSVNPKDVFGGIATALAFYRELIEELQCDSRIIVVDREININEMVSLDGYEIMDSSVQSTDAKQLIDMTVRTNKKLIVSDKDVFMATAWWTAYILEPIIEWQALEYNQEQKPLIYFIQDFEPGFYPWSSRYVMAESTYKTSIPIMGIFNSKLLYDYFERQGYTFYKQWYFEPTLNEELQKYLQGIEKFPERKKQILIYGRPGTARNAFELIMESLREWVNLQDDAKDWRILSAGEKFSDINLGKGVKVKSLGKLSLEEYAQVMLETKVGISLMVSPHPSYPPLEMATFGLKVITNTYYNKDLSDFSENIISVDNCSAGNIAKILYNLCNDETYDNQIADNRDYKDSTKQWRYILKEIIEEFENNA